VNLFEIVKEEASKTYINETELTAFMQGFEKESSIWSAVEARPEVLAAGIKAGMGIVAGLAGVGIYKAITSTSSTITNFALKSKFESALQFVKNNNKIVKNGNQAKVDSYAHTLFSFAPHVAADPNILSSLLANAVLGEGIDPMTVKSITDLEGRYKENIAPNPLIGIRT
jgi:hypothetical protein